MKGTIENLTICSRKCILYIPGKYDASQMRYPVVYVNGEDGISDVMKNVERHFDSDCREFILLSIQSDNWNDDYTPWAAPPLSKGGDPFGGCAAGYIDFLLNDIKPFMDANYKTKPEPCNTALIGYSLGGLAALYALYKTPVFGKIGSLSGSLWYDGWMEFMKSHTPVNTDSKIYLSLGKKEECTHNRYMKQVGGCTREAFKIFSGQLSSEENITLRWNNGGHFTDIPDRFAKALLWVMS